MKKDIFDYKDYKSYLHHFIERQPKNGRGVRLAMAKHLSSPVSHVSQLLNGNSHLSLEQAEGLNDFFGHTQDEAHFFILLVQLARSGTQALKKRIHIQIEQVLEKRLFMKERLGINQTISKEDQAEFYSSWIYGAVHVMLTIPEFQNKENLSKHLGLSLKRTSEILEFLVTIGLVMKKDGGKYEVGTSRIHLGSDSPLISKFHTNWRVKSIQSLEKDKIADDLHYSSAITISQSDIFKIKSLLIKYIEELKQIIKDSPAESVHCLNLDFFKL